MIIKNRKLVRRDNLGKIADYIDPLWQSGHVKRSEVYKWLRHELGREIHIGESDIETCKQIIELRWEGE